MIAAARAHLEQSGAPDPERQALMHYAAILDREALTMTFNDQFLFLAVVIGLSAFAMLFLRPRARTGAQPAQAQEAMAL